jgi:hypothetical protein
LSLLFCLAIAATWIRSYFSFSEQLEARHYRMVGQALRYSTFQLYLSKGAFQYGNAWYDISDARLINAMFPTGKSSWQFSCINLGGVLYFPPPNGSIAGTAFSYTPALATKGHVAQIDARVPYWVLVTPLSFLPILWIARFRRERARDRLNPSEFCIGCGYDLRATPDQCPECGVIPQKQI